MTKNRPKSNQRRRQNSLFLFSLSLVLAMMMVIELIMHNVLSSNDNAAVNNLPIIPKQRQESARNKNRTLLTFELVYESTPKSVSLNEKQQRHNQEDTQTTTATVSSDINQTIQVLLSMGVKHSDLKEHLREVPKWSQILNNYGGSNEPVVLGLDYCEEYRQTTKKKQRAIGPAGLFSSGTNLLHDLIKSNCDPPGHNPLKFALRQVPWGKHNPPEARGLHRVKNGKNLIQNTMAVMPVVSIRHPYTWMSAMCKHSYG
jgi:hypothetical protein